MATPFESTPTWFNAEYYLGTKLAQLLADDPKGGWTRATMIEAFNAAGFTNPYDHYMAYGDGENLSPNAMFNNTEYLAAKAAQMGPAWTTEMVAKAIRDAGMTLMEHYEKYGSAEGVNPSSAFNQDKYFDAKLEQLMAAEPDKGWTLEKVKEAFAAAGLTPLDHFLLYSKEEGLQDAKYDYSDNGKPIPHPGSEITLTTGADVVGPGAAEGFMTSSRDDVINAVSSTVSTKGTLNATDVIDGSAGRDVLNIDMQSNFGGFKDNGGVKNVETIALENAGGKSFDAKGVVAAEQYTMSLGAKATTIKNVDTTATTFVVAADKGAELNVQFTDAALSGKTDSVTMMLNGVGDDTGAMKLTVGGGSTSSSAVAETLVLNSAGKANAVTVAGKHDAIVVTNEADITVNANAGGLKSFDAATALGDVKANLSNNTDTLKTINGGLGDDTITVTGLASSAVLDGGDGTDTLKFEASGALSALSLKQHISGFETIEVVGKASTATNHVIDMTNITDLTTLKYDGFVTYDTTSPAVESFEVKNSSVSDFTFQIQDKTTHADPSDPLRDPGAVTQLTYGGTGALNVELVGDTGTGFSGLNGLTAKNITELNIRTDHDKAGLLVMGVTANSVENITIDTTGGAGAALYTDDNGRLTGAGGSLSALQNIVVKGDGEVEIVANGTEKALTSVDASELKGSLSLDLHTIAAGKDGKGIEIHMGSGGTEGDLWDSGIKGTKGNDTIILGAGEDTVVFAADLANNGKDTISNFGSDDQLNVAALGVSGSDSIIHVAATGSKVTATGQHAVVIDNGGVAFGISSSTVTISNYTDTAQVAEFLNVGVTVTKSTSNVFVINDVAGKSAYVYHFVNASDSTVAANELSLVGIITDNGTLDTGNVVFA